jgi:hypothetical protein
MRLLVAYIIAHMVIALSMWPTDFYRNSTDTYYTKEYIYDNNLNLYAPIQFTSVGIQSFLQNTFNNSLYPEVLSNNFSHLVQFFEQAKRTKQQRAYIKSVLRLFTNKLKSTSYVNTYAFEALLEQLPGLLNEYFITFKLNELDAVQSTINELLYSSFLSKFGILKENPQLFFDSLSQEITNTLNNKYVFINEISADELRKTVIVFMELSLNKLIWSPQEQIQTWESVKRIGNHLEALAESNIIADIDDLNDLFITLIERYCFFLDIMQEELTIDFYEKIKSDLALHTFSFLELEESEEFIETKKQRLIRALAQGEAKARSTLIKTS